MFAGVRGRQIAGRFTVIPAAPFAYGTGAQRGQWRALIAALESLLRLHRRHARNRRAHNDVANGANDIANDVEGVPNAVAAIQPFDNAVRPVNGAARCPTADTNSPSSPSSSPSTPPTSKPGGDHRPLPLTTPRLVTFDEQHWSLSVSERQQRSTCPSDGEEMFASAAVSLSEQGPTSTK